MSVPAPHFLLFSESRLKRKDVEEKTEPESVQTVGHWRFVLESLDGQEKFEADDEEPVAQGDRLELLAVIRGLEALDQPSRVTLVTPSRYVSRGLRFGLEQWRESGWLWERFGEMAPVKNHDLWQRIDRALTFHQVDCRTWQFDQEDLSEIELPQQTSDAAKGRGRHVAEANDVSCTRSAAASEPTSCWSRGLPGFCKRLIGKLRQAMQPTPRRKGRTDAPHSAPQLQA